MPEVPNSGKMSIVATYAEIFVLDHAGLPSGQVLGVVAPHLRRFWANSANLAPLQKPANQPDEDADPEQDDHEHLRGDPPINHADGLPHMGPEPFHALPPSGFALRR